MQSAFVQVELRGKIDQARFTTRCGDGFEQEHRPLHGLDAPIFVDHGHG